MIAKKNNIGIVLPVYNRPIYLKQTLDSLVQTILPEFTTILMIDDASTSEETRRLFDEFEMPKIRVIKVRNLTNKGIADNLKWGWNYFMNNGFDIFVNVDSDVIFKPDWLIKLLLLREKCPNEIISGFQIQNSAAVNIIHEENDCRVTNFCGGINLMFDHGNYHLVMECLEKNEMWDFTLAEKMHELKRYYITTKPSVLQHIGLNSSIGHSAQWHTFDFDNEIIIRE